MSLPLPDLLDPWRAVDSRSDFAGRLPLCKMARLSDLVLDSSGEADYRLTFFRDERRLAVVTGEVRASLRLQCQRCLGPLRKDVSARVAIAMVRGMDEAGQLPEQYDPLLVSEPLIRPRDVVEDELLLSLPQIPMHDAEECGAASDAWISDGEPDAGATSPFAALSSWKRDR